MAQQESAYQVALRELRWSPGWQLSVSDCSRFCELSSDSRFQALHWGLDWGVRSGRLPCWERGFDGQRYFVQEHQRLSSVQLRALLARAAQRLEGHASQADALRALQAELGVVVR